MHLISPRSLAPAIFKKLIKEIMKNQTLMLLLNKLYDFLIVMFHVIITLIPLSAMHFVLGCSYLSLTFVALIEEG